MASGGSIVKKENDNVDLGYSSKSVSPESTKVRRESVGDCEAMETSTSPVLITDRNQVCDSVTWLLELNDR